MPKNIIKFVFVTLIFICSTIYAQTILNESFTGTTFPPTGWTKYNLDTQGNDTSAAACWVRKTSTYYSSPASAYCREHEPNPGTYPNNDWLVTPQLFPTASKCTLKFYYRDYCGAGCSLEVWVSRAGNTPADFQNPSYGFKVLAFTGKKTSFKSKKVVLSSFVNQLVYIAFRYCGKITNRQGVYLDNIQGISFPTVDAGVSAISTPDTVVPHGEIYPSATVNNYGADMASFWTRCVIETITGTRTVYSDSVYISNLNANGFIRASYSRPITLNGGWYRIKFKTLLSGDMQPSNDSMVRTFRVIPAYHDVGVTTVLAPLDSNVQYNQNVYPNVQVRNFGSGPDPIPVTIIIKNVQTGATVYTGTASSSSNIPALQTTTLLATTPWNVSIGTYQVIAFTTLSTDQNRANDTSKAFVYCPLRDVGVDSILTPSDSVLYPVSFTPKAKVKNYGAVYASFYTRCVIELIGTGIVYRDSVWTSNLTPVLTTDLTFNAITLNPGQYQIKFTTLYSQDYIAANNEKIMNFRVRPPIYHDAGVYSIEIPNGQVQNGNAYTPQVVVTNYGNEPEIIPVTIKIYNYSNPSVPVYTSATGTISLNAGSSGIFTATTSWTATYGYFQVVAYTSLSTDQNVYNDTCLASVQCPYIDASIISINTPVGGLAYNNPYTPSVQVKNYGTDAAVIPVVIKIKDLGTSNIIYTSPAGNISLAPNATGTYTASSTWNAPYGYFQVIAYTNLTGDMNISNDSAYANAQCINVDAGVTSIITPIDELNNGSSYIPSVTVKNYSTDPKTIPVTIKIKDLGTSNIVYIMSGGNIYLAGNASGTYTATEGWSAYYGNFRVFAYTSLSGDLNPYNDTCYANALCSQYDAGVVSINTPIGELTNNNSYTSSVIVKNYGNVTSSIPVAIKIFSTANLDVPVYTSPVGNITLAANASGTYTATSSWLAVLGLYKVVAYTYLSGDDNHQNDTCYGDAQCTQKDVGVVAITRPDTIELPSGGFNPSTNVKNFGTVATSFFTKCVIETITGARVIYKESLYYNNLAAGATTPLTFNPLTISTGGNFRIKIITLLADDIDRSNDTMIKVFRVIPNDYHDAGVSAIYQPMGELNYQQVYYPSVQVRNYGAQAESIPTTIKIINLQTNNVFHTYTTKIWLNPLTSGTINDPIPWTTTVGVFQVTAHTNLISDADRSNDTCHAGALVSNIDAAVFSIENPSIIEPTTIVYPTAKILNNSWKPRTFNVTFKINDNSNYSDTKQFSLGASKDTIMTFNAWTAYPGTFAFSCSTDLAGDMNRTNDKKTSSIFVPYRDVAAIEIVEPLDTINTEELVPRARVMNNSNYPLITPVEMTIFNNDLMLVFCDTTTVDIIANTPGVAYFNDWTPPASGKYFIKIKTMFVPDLVSTNDTISTSFFVRNPFCDIYLVSVRSPGDTVGTGYPVIPKVTIRNTGNVSLPFAVITEISRGGNLVYMPCTSYFSNPLPPTQEAQLYFRNFNPDPNNPGAYTITSRLLNSDDNFENDTASKNFTVISNANRDVGVFSIVSPSSYEITPGVIPLKAKIYNNGNINTNLSDLKVFFKITPQGRAMPIFEQRDSFELSRQGSNGDQLTATFPSWCTCLGDFVLTCSTAYVGDNNPINNVIRKTLKVTPVTISGWINTIQYPNNIATGIRDGGALTYVPENTENGAAALYAFPGGKLAEFWRYSIDDNNWSQMQPIPGTKIKIGKGAALCSDGENYIYAIIGNNTKSFWVYSISDNNWTLLDSVNVDPNHKKKLKGGSGLAYITKGDSHFVYVNKGSKTNEFYAYYIEGRTWFTKETIPAGSQRILPNNGSCLTTDRVNYIYLLKQKYNELLRYDVANNIWENLARMSNEVLTRKKVGPGSSMAYDINNNIIYALKGNNTREFWQYNVAANQWTYLENEMIPEGLLRKKVKSGGALTFANEHLYAFKGNRTSEFYKYIPRTSEFNDDNIETKSIENAMGNQNGNIKNISVTVQPNIIKDVINLKYQNGNTYPLHIKLYSIIGDLVYDDERILTTNNGTFSIDASNISAGVYFIQIENANNKFNERIVVQK